MADKKVCLVGGGGIGNFKIENGPEIIIPCILRYCLLFLIIRSREASGKDATKGIAANLQRLQNIKNLLFGFFQFVFHIDNDLLYFRMVCF